MTSAEWNEAFRKGDPAAVGQMILAAIRQAHAEQTAIPDDDYRITDIGELAPTRDGSERPDYVIKLCTRAGSILRDQGVIVIPGEQWDAAERSE
jgi:hypothetical protein